MEPTSPIARAADLAALRFRSDVSTDERDAATRSFYDDPSTLVRSAALTALAHISPRDAARDLWLQAVVDDDAALVLRCCELAPHVADVADTAVLEHLVRLVGVDDDTVAEAAAAALGECAPQSTEPTRTTVVTTLAHAAQEHSDALVREAAIAALGAVGDERGLPAILNGCQDKATVRRRAVLALAPFDGPDVEAAVAAARDDRDWQVRQAAELFDTEAS